MRIRCETEGASIGYRVPSEEERWLLYSGPIRARRGTTIVAKAHRIGWKPSEEVETKVDRR